MNKEYIEREVVLNAMSKAQSDRTWSMDNCDVMCQMFDYVEEVPAADVAPVVHGEWLSLEQEIGLYECSLCGHRILRTKSSYCPNCGAHMDGGN